MTHSLCLQLAAWVDEKMLTVQDASYGGARGLHGKWQKHQAFMAELAANEAWLEKIKAVSPIEVRWPRAWLGDVAHTELTTVPTGGHGAGELQTTVRCSGGPAAGRAAGAVEWTARRCQGEGPAALRGQPH